MWSSNETGSSLLPLQFLCQGAYLDSVIRQIVPLALEYIFAADRERNGEGGVEVEARVRCVECKVCVPGKGPCSVIALHRNIVAIC
jgi:hypothetical protein